MAETLTAVSRKDLVKRLMDGERDFSSTRLSGDETALVEAEGYSDLIKYLKEQDLRTEPVTAENSDWSGLKAPGLFMQFIKAAGINLSGADLRGADFRRGDFKEADFHEANLTGAFLIVSSFQHANFAGAVLRGADLYEASVAGANLRGADMTRGFLLRLAFKEADVTGSVFTGALLYRADLRGAIGLDKVTDLGTAIFHQTAITAVEAAIIDAAKSDLPQFDVRAE